MLKGFPPLKRGAFTVFPVIPMEGREVGCPHVRFEAENRTWIVVTGCNGSTGGGIQTALRAKRER